MKIRSFKSLSNATYRVVIHTEDWSEGDRGLMLRFGEPAIDVGGEFSDGSDVVFELDVSLKRVLSNSPFSYVFDSRDSVDAESHAEIWEAAIVARITAAVETLRLSTDDFTREAVTTI